MTKKKPSNDPYAPENQDGGGFATGFFIGILSGAAGMFFLNSEQGKKFWKSMKAEFEPKVNDLKESPEIQSLIDEVQEVKQQAQAAVKDLQDKFPKFSAHRKTHNDSDEPSE